MRHQRAIFVGRTLCTFLLLSGLTLSTLAQKRVVPVPVFDTTAKNAKAADYREALDEMAELLCREPKSGRSGEWKSIFNTLEARLITAEHAVIWAAAGGVSDDDLRLFDKFNDVKGKIVRLIDKAFVNKPGKRPLGAEKFKNIESEFAVAARNARFERPIASVHALRTMLFELNQAADKAIDIADFREYVSLRNEALEILGEIQFQIYSRGLEAVRAKVPRDATFPFMLHSSSKENETRSLTILMAELLGAELARSIVADQVAEFDTDYKWQRLAPFSPTGFSGPVKLELRGQCPAIAVKVIFDKPSREADAAAVRDILSDHNFVPEMEGLSGADSGRPGEFKRIYYQNNGTVADAEFIRSLLKDIERFRVGSGHGNVYGRSDHTIWLRERPRPKENDIRLIYSEDRTDDAMEAFNLLEDNGYDVEPKKFIISEFILTNPNKVVFRRSIGGSLDEARSIARLIRSFEAVEPSDAGEANLREQATYDIWMITKKEIDLNGIWLGYNYNCPGNPEVTQIRITHTGDGFIAHKVSGGKCVRDGEVTLRGRIRGTVMTGEQNFQIGGGTQREFKSTNFKIENKDLITVGGTIQLRRKVN